MIWSFFFGLQICEITQFMTSSDIYFYFTFYMFLRSSYHLDRFNSTIQHLFSVYLANLDLKRQINNYLESETKKKKLLL
jgi:hypothetical protein